MLPIVPAPEPDRFDLEVRQEGKKYLKKNPHPTTNQWKYKALWILVKDDLRDAFGGVCAYSCHWVAEDTGWATCEHFIDKNSRPDLAYEWNNYRFVCGVLNGRKKNYSVLDPFQIKAGTFIIDFPSLLVKPSDSLNEVEYNLAHDTITILGLNDESTCLKGRQSHVMEYVRGCINLDYLERHAPFIFSELNRQGLIETVKEMMLAGS